MFGKRPRKLFVLDTNVILHDSSSLYKFADNDVVIPITVIEELDSFKKGNESVNYHARQFLRELDALSGEKLFEDGAPLGEGKGRILVRLERQAAPEMESNFRKDKPDNHILNIALTLAKEGGREVIVVSKDVNLRLKAKALGLPAQDYKSDQVKDVETLYKGHRPVESAPDALLEALRGESGQAPLSALPCAAELSPNEYLDIRGAAGSVLAVNDAALGRLRRVESPAAYGIAPRNPEQAFALDALLSPDIQLVSLSGKAGTGKTLLALAAALERRRAFRQIFMARPVVPLSNKDLGFLPGDVNAKLDPYMKPLFDNLGVIQNQFGETDPKGARIKEMLEQEKLVISPLSFIRGRSLVQIFFIVDEAQNLTPHEIKTIITRAGEGTKMVFTGDIHQIDHPYLDKQSNGLSYLIERMRGQSLYSHVTLERGERSRLAEMASNLL